MGIALGGFQHRVFRWITGIHSKRRVDGSWEQPTLETVMEEVGFENVGTYVLKRQNTVAHYIATRIILDLC